MIDYDIKKGKLDILYMRFSGNLDESDFEKFKEIFMNELTNKKTIVFDMRETTWVNVSLIKNLALFMTDFENLIKENLVASSIIITQLWIQSIIKMLFSLRKPTKPNYIAPSPEEAEEFLKDNIDLFMLQARKMN